MTLNTKSDGAVPLHLLHPDLPVYCCIEMDILPLQDLDELVTV